MNAIQLESALKVPGIQDMALNVTLSFDKEEVCTLIEVGQLKFQRLLLIKIQKEFPMDWFPGWKEVFKHFYTCNEIRKVRAFTSGMVNFLEDRYIIPRCDEILGQIQENQISPATENEDQQLSKELELAKKIYEKITRLKIPNREVIKH